MSTVPSRNCLRELKIFLKNVLNAFDLHETFAALLLYSFGPRRLIEVVKTALTDENQIDEVHGIINDLAEYVNGELRMMMRNPSLQDVTELKQRLCLAWEVLQVYEKHFVDSDFQIVIEELLKDLNALFMQGYLPEESIPDEVLTYFGQNLIIPGTLISRSRDIVSDAPKVEEPPCEFVQKLTEAVAKLKLKARDIQPYNEICCYSFDGNNILDKKNAVKALEILNSEWDCVLLSPDIIESTFVILEKIIGSVKESNEKKSVFQEASRMLLERGLPAFENSIKNFHQRLSNSVNRIGSHNSVQSDPLAFEQLRNEVRFLLLVSPKFTLQAVIRQCLNNADYTPAVVKIFRGCQLMCNAIITYNKMKMPLLVGIIDEAYNQNIDRLKSPDFVDRLAYVISAFCRRKRSVIKEKGEEGKFLRAVFGDVLEYSILCPTDIISFHVVHTIFKFASIDHVKAQLTILKRIFSLTGAKDCEMSYTVHIQVEDCHGTIPVPQLILFMHRMLLQFEKQDNDIPALCIHILKGMGAKLKEDNIIFPNETTSFLLKEFSRDAWWFRYAITEWFSYSMNNPPKEIPSGLFHATAEEYRANWKELKVDFECAPVGCLLISLFELGLFDAELAIELLSHGVERLPLNDLLFDQIAMALCDCCAKPFFCNRISSIVLVLERIIDLFDPSIRIPYVLDQVNDNILRAVRQMKSIQLVGRAAKMAFIKMANHNSKFACYYPMMSLDRPKDPSEVADQLLQAFCELTKIQIEKQIQAYRILMKKASRGDKTSELESQKLEEQLIAQLVVVFHDAVMFSQFEPKNKALNVLIPALADHVKEMQNNHKNTSLDIAKISHRKVEYVYTNVQEDDTLSPLPSAPKISTDLVLPKGFYRGYGDPHYNHPSQRHISGYINPKKDCARGDFKENQVRNRFTVSSTAMKAAAGQITHEKTREQVQRRLNGSSPPRGPPQNRNQQSQNKGNHFSGRNNRSRQPFSNSQQNRPPPLAKT